MTNLATIAKQQYAHAYAHPTISRPANLKDYQVQLPRGLTLTLIMYPTITQLSLTRLIPGPSVEEQKTCRHYYDVPADATEHRAERGRYTVITYQWPTDKPQGETHADPKALPDRQPSTDAQDDTLWQ